MSREIVKVLLSADGKRRVAVIRRADGYYGLLPQYRYRNIHEGALVAEGWATLPADASFFESAEIAEREARAEFNWVAGGVSVSVASAKWIEAGVILGRDPSAKVDCPECSKAPLSVSDSEPYSLPAMISRYLSCPACGARNILDRLRI
jgi:hypothetical protein